MTDRHDKSPARQRHSATRGASTAPRGAPAAKMLITAASLAATLGGWALLAQGSPRATAPAGYSSPAALAAARSLNLAPLPTVVPVPDLVAGQTETAPPIPSLRSVTAPRAARAPIIITRSSR